MKKSTSGHSSNARGATPLSLKPATPRQSAPLQLYTVAEAAVLMRMKAKTVRKLIAYRMLEAVKKGVGTKRAPYLISHAAIEKYLESRTQQAEF